MGGNKISGMLKWEHSHIGRIIRIESQTKHGTWRHKNPNSANSHICGIIRSVNPAMSKSVSISQGSGWIECDYSILLPAKSL